MSLAHTDDRRWMQLAIELTYQCPRTDNAYAVGAVIVDVAGTEISRGYSRETDPKIHAEESALTKLALDDPRLDGATIYSTLEPCAVRMSRPKGCAQLIVDAGIRRAVIAWREPALFVSDQQGVEMLRTAGVIVDELPEMAEAAKGANLHLTL